MNTTKTLLGILVLLLNLPACQGDSAPGSETASNNLSEAATGGAAGSASAAGSESGGSGGKEGPAGAGGAGGMVVAGSGGVGGQAGSAVQDPTCADALFQNACSDGSATGAQCYPMLGSLLVTKDHCRIAPVIAICSDTTRGPGEFGACYDIPRGNGEVDVLFTTSSFNLSAEMIARGIKKNGCASEMSDVPQCPASPLPTWRRPGAGGENGGDGGG